MNDRFDRFDYFTYREGSRDGRGEYLYKSTGDVYIGDWKGGLRSGQGKMVWASSDGNSYEGGWVNGTMDGQGEYRWARSGTRFTGLFRFGLRTELGTFTFKSGAVVAATK